MDCCDKVTRLSIFSKDYNNFQNSTLFDIHHQCMMSGRRPRVYMTQSVPQEVAAMKELRDTCEVEMYDEKEYGAMVISRDILLKKVQGIDALFLAFPVKVDTDVLDAAGLFCSCKMFCNFAIVPIL